MKPLISFFLHTVYTEWVTKKYPAFRFVRVLVVFSLVLVCTLRRVFEQLVNSRAVTMLRYTRCNIVILMGGGFLWGHLKSTVYESNPHTIQKLKVNIRHAAAAIKVTMLHRVNLNIMTRKQLCIDAGGNHFQHLLWCYILSAFAYCINPLRPNGACMGRTAPLTSKSCILYIYSTNIGTEYFKHGIYSPFFFLSSKCSLFHNSNVFGSCIIHILYTGCAKI